MRSRLPQIGRPILYEPHQVTALVPIPDRSKSPASGSRKKGIDLSRPVTEALRANEKSTQASHHGYARTTRHSRTRMVLTVSFVLFPVTELDCHRHLADISAKLSASVGAPEPHDFAVRLGGARLRRNPRPLHPAPNVRDDRDTPLCSRGGTGGACRDDLPDG